MQTNDHNSNNENRGNLGKFLIPLLALGLGFFLGNFLSGGNDNDHEVPTEDATPAVAVAPKGIISIDNAQKMYSSYSKGRVKLIDNFEGNGFNATRYIDFSFKDIENYLEYVKQETQKAKKEPENLRIYLSRYNDNGSKYSKHNTVFILPTIDDKGYYLDNNTIKFIRDRKSNTQEGGQIQQQNNLQEAGFLSSLSTTSNTLKEESLILNQGTIVPPPFQETDFED